MTKQQAYVPGVCNINKAEIAYRRKVMYIALAVTVGLLIALVLLQVNVFLRSAILFLPLLSAIISYLQVENRFCVAYAVRGKHNAADDHEGSKKVIDKEDRETDRKKAEEMNVQAVIATVVILIVLLFVPSV